MIYKDLKLKSILGFLFKMELWFYVWVYICYFKYIVMIKKNFKVKKLKIYGWIKSLFMNMKM